MNEEPEADSQADARSRERKAVRESMQDQRRSAEPLIGPVVRFVLILLVVGSPLLLMTFAVVHMDVVAQEMVVVRARGDLPVDLTDTDLYYLIATTPGLVLYSLGFACGVSSAVITAIGIIAGIWVGVGHLVGSQRGKAAHRKYGRLVGDEVTVAADAWQKNLPVGEPDTDPGEPDTDRHEGE